MAVNYLQLAFKINEWLSAIPRTLLELKVHDAFIQGQRRHNRYPTTSPGESFRDTALRTMGRDVFLTSVNVLSQTGEMVNIDGKRQSCSSFFIWFPKRCSLR